MDQRIVNKQISINQIVDAAEYIEKYRQNYINTFRYAKENSIRTGQNWYDYKNGYSEIYYTIKFHDGRSVRESDYAWFVQSTLNPKNIKEIYITVNISFTTKSLEQENQYDYKKINARLMFYDSSTTTKNSTATIEVETTHLEEEGNKVYSDLMSILESNEDRYNNTLKNKGLIIKSITVSAGILLSYVLYFILFINKSKFSEIAIMFFDDKYILILGQWFVAILLGYLTTYWYIISLYRPISPTALYSGRKTLSNEPKYTVDSDTYNKYCEVQIGDFWDAVKRREKIDNLYKISKIILIAQAIISAMMLILMK